jgi:hypothetical protein
MLGQTNAIGEHRNYRTWETERCSVDLSLFMNTRMSRRENVPNS